MNWKKKRAILIAVSLVLTFVVLRVYLYLSPDTNLDVGPYNIHHLFTGLLLITFAGIPLMLSDNDNNFLNFAAILFGSGLSMALDQWVYLIATDGSDSAYLSPISFWGGAFMIGLVFIYIMVLFLYIKKTKRKQTAQT